MTVGQEEVGTGAHAGPNGSPPNSSRRLSRMMDRASSRRLLSPVVIAAVVVPFAVAVATALIGPLLTVVVLAGPVAFVALTRGNFDGVTVLTGLVLLLFFVPSRLVVGPLGSAGTPAAIVGLAAAWLWANGLIAPGLALARGRQPVRLVVLAFAAAHLASYVAAFMRPLDFLEKNAADRGIITMASSVGIALIAADGIATRARLETLLRRIAFAGAGLAVIGIVQFTVGLDLAARIRVPGLTSQVSALTFIDQRSIFRRVAGTTQHAIEFSVVLAILFPLALHLALYAPLGRRRRWWLAVALIAVALPMSVSRTAVVGMAAVALMLIPSWSRHRRRRAVLGIALYAVVMKLVVPGLLGTIKSLFLNAGVDPSVSSRQADYDYVGRFISERPVFGRGFSTFIPTRYDFLDNQFLLSLIETGIVGLVSLLALFLVGMGVARGARLISTDPKTRDLGQSLAASVMVAVVTCATFDFLSFPTGRILVFLLVGCSGALWRLERRREALPQDLSTAIGSA